MYSQFQDKQDGYELWAEHSAFKGPGVRPPKESVSSTP